MRQIRNRLRYIIVLCFDIYMMIFFHSYINFLILIALVILPIWSVHAVRMVKKQIGCDIEVPYEPMKKAEEFDVRFILHNQTIYPVLNATLTVLIENRFYAEVSEHQLNLPVRRKGDTHATYHIQMEYCGRFAVTVEKLRLGDLFGLYEVEMPLDKEKECLILPDGQERNQEAGMIYQLGVSEAMESQKKGYDFSEVSGIREYIPGDKLQNIHWKLSVKKDQLMVKERISVSALQLSVLVDLVNDDAMCLEKILELTDSITKAFVKLNYAFSFYYYSVNSGGIREMVIGNEAERKTAFEMMLYDHSYKEIGLIEELFLKQYTAGTYLYIGYGNAEAASQDVIQLPGNVLAQLRSRE